MRLIDTHSHIYAQEFDADRAEMVQRAQGAGVDRILMPAIDSSTHEQMIEAEKIFPGNCVSMMGLHPCSVKEDFKQELAIAEKYFGERKFVAVGETGLDYYWDLSFTKQQEEAFQTQINWSLQFDLPVVIHSRNSIDDCIELIRKNQNGKLKPVFHCFSGTVEQANRIISLGGYLGIGGVITFKKSGLDSVMQQISLDKILLETDAPYLAPVPFRGKRNECSYLHYVVQKLAEVKNLTTAEVAQITTKNAERIFQL